MKLDLYNQKGEKKGTVEAPDEFFSVDWKPGLVHDALVRQEANQRIPAAHTQTKGEVRGGGRKPFRQKGTGNARAGTKRNPHMKGGGVTFGPRNARNFTKMMPRKMRRTAIFSALSEKTRKGEVFALDAFESTEMKTKEFAAMLKVLPIKREALFVLPERHEAMRRTSKNLPNVKTMLVNYLNIRDLRKYEQVVFVKEAIQKMKEVFGNNEAKKRKKVAA